MIFIYQIQNLSALINYQNKFFLFSVMELFICNCTINNNQWSIAEKKLYKSKIGKQCQKNIHTMNIIY